MATSRRRRASGKLGMACTPKRPLTASAGLSTKRAGDYWNCDSIGDSVISTRRFWARPSSVALLATGWLMP